MSATPNATSPRPPLASLPLPQPGIIERLGQDSWQRFLRGSWILFGNPDLALSWLLLLLLWSSFSLLLLSLKTERDDLSSEQILLRDRLEKAQINAAKHLEDKDNTTKELDRVLEKHERYLSLPLLHSPFIQSRQVHEDRWPLFPTILPCSSEFRVTRNPRSWEAHRMAFPLHPPWIQLWSFIPDMILQHPALASMKDRI